MLIVFLSFILSWSHTFVILLIGLNDETSMRDWYDEISIYIFPKVKEKSV